MNVTDELSSDDHADGQTTVVTSATDEEFVANLIKSRNIEEKPSDVLKKKLGIVILLLLLLTLTLLLLLTLT